MNIISTIIHHFYYYKIIGTSLTPATHTSSSKRLVGKLHLPGCRPDLHFITCWKWYFIVRSVLGTELLRGSHELLSASQKSVTDSFLSSTRKVNYLEYFVITNITHEPFDLKAFPATVLPNQWHFDDVKENYPVLFYLSLSEMNTRKLSSFPCVDLNWSRASCRRPEQRLQLHAATCLGLPLPRRMFGVSSHVEMNEARADDTFSRARAAHTAFCGSTRRHMGHVLMLKTWHVGWGEGGSSGMFCFPCMRLPFGCLTPFPF